MHRQVPMAALTQSLSSFLQVLNYFSVETSDKASIKNKKQQVYKSE